jgi:hypothetical protein
MDYLSIVLTPVRIHWTVPLRWGAGGSQEYFLLTTLLARLFFVREKQGYSFMPLILV